MSKILTFYCLVSFFFIQNGAAQETWLEKQLKSADSLWLCEKLSPAMDQYKQMIARGNIPEEYRSLIFLRLADAQYQAGLYGDCRKTLSESRTLPFLPEHHRLKMEELEEKLKGNPVNENITIPSNERTITTFYVSQSAKDLKRADIQGKCFPSIEKALEAVRLYLQKPDLPEGAVEIVLLGDTYKIRQSVHMDSKNSATRKNPLVIRSLYQKHKTQITGGVTLKNWLKETDPEILARLPQNARGKVLCADLKKMEASAIDSLVFGGFSSARTHPGNARFNTFPVPEFFYEGKPQNMARWPNEKDTLIPLASFKDARIIRWASETDLWLHGYWYYMWADAYEKVKSVSVTDTTIKLEPPVNKYGFGNSKWHVLNSLSEMDIPGEWCLSVKKEKIWFYPTDDFHPEKCTLSLTGPAFQIENCDYLTIKDIDIGTIRGDGMIFANCSDLILSGCTIKDASGMGIKINGGTRQLVHSCIIESMGRGGIDINSGNVPTLESSGSTIENCQISHLSRIDRTYTPAILLEGVGIKVRHCLFSDIPSSAIRLEGNDMLIEMNEFAHCVIESDDQGAIDVWGNPLYRGNIIRWNYFHDIGVPHLHMAAGVRLDDAISGFCIYENLFFRASNDLFGGIQIHGGMDNYIEGNLFSDCNAAISQSAWGDERWKKTLVQKDHPAFLALKKIDWQSELWQKRYPALKNLREGIADRNFCMDNIAVNAQSFYLRKSEKLQSLNNTSVSEEFIPDSVADFKKYIVPWHPVPIDRIGPYSNIP
jgi:hypothetical protein